MTDYVAVIAAIIAGVFSIISASMIRKLTNDAKKEERKHVTHSEKKALYVKTHELYENAIKSSRNYNSTHLSELFSKLTAEINLIASEEVIGQYLIVADLFEEWVKLFIKAFPAPKKIGDQAYITLQAPDPTLKFKPLEKYAYEKFYSSYQELIKLMRAELLTVEQNL